MRIHILFILLLTTIMGGMLLVDAVLAWTWLVPSEVPTIPAAMISASAGDTILVAPGTYYLQRLHITDGVMLTSSHGANFTSITPDPALWPDTDCGLLCISLMDYTEISGFHIYGYRPGLIDDTSASIYISNCSNIVIQRNVIETSAWAIHIHDIYGSLVTVTNNTFYGDHIVLEYQSPIFLDLGNNILWGDMIIGEGASIVVTCNDFMNAGDIPSFGIDNFSADPQFCGTGSSGNFYLQSDSPCAPNNHPDGVYCGYIGALPVGCGTVQTEKRTWGSIKALHNE